MPVSCLLFIVTPPICSRYIKGAPHVCQTLSQELGLSHEQVKGPTLMGHLPVGRQGVSGINAVKGLRQRGALRGKIREGELCF